MSAELAMSGTPAQIEWAGQIKLRVNADFDRVSAALQQAAATRGEQLRSDTSTVLAILEEKRAEVMSSPDAGYFIRDWQELSDQVRRLIVKDPRYLAIQARKKEGKNAKKTGKKT